MEKINIEDVSDKSDESLKPLGESQLERLKIGVIGAGKLAYAIVCGILKKTNIKAQNICVSAKTDINLFKFKEKDCEVTKRNYEVFTRFDCDIVFLCFPSSVIKQCYRIGCDKKPIPFTIDYIPVPKHSLIVLSLVSGVKLDQIIACLINPEDVKKFPLTVHRLVLNTCVAYGTCFGAIDVDPEKCHPFVKELLSKISTLEYVPESEIDNLCSFSTSGLLLSHYFCSGLTKASSKLGLSHTNDIYLKMSAYAMLTAAKTVLRAEKSPLDLIEESTSLSSTSLHGFQVLEDLNFDLLLNTAFNAINRRIQDSNESNDYQI